jgi:hypothetical protein
MSHISLSIQLFMGTGLIYNLALMNSATVIIGIQVSLQYADFDSFSIYIKECYSWII